MSSDGDSSIFAHDSPVSPQAHQWFRLVDCDFSGRINSEELHAALMCGRGEEFSHNTCKLMIRMFDNDSNGTIDIYEFGKLLDYINEWIEVFRKYDRDDSGRIEKEELQVVLTQMGFRFTPAFIEFLVKKCGAQNREIGITIDQFIMLRTQIQRLTEAFKQRDKEQNGTITIGFEDFLSLAIGFDY